MLALSLTRRFQRHVAAPVANVRRAAPAAGASVERAMLERHAGERYVVRRELGRGGMGIVFLAYDARLGREVAIKVLRADLASSAAQRERFRTEARALARLDHAGIVSVYGFDEDGPLAYFVMRYVEGESLGDRLDRDGYIDAQTTTAVLAKLGDALAHAHAQGLVHRDLKAENILLDANGEPVIIDFGVALERKTAMPNGGRTMGTPQYMSPEQAAADHDLDGRSDIYSLGVLAYQLLSGQLPFDGATFSVIAAQHVVQPPRSLRTIAPHVPESLSRIVHRCLAKRREDRWDNAMALAHALRAHMRRSSPRAAALAHAASGGSPLRLMLHVVTAAGLLRVALERLTA